MKKIILGRISLVDKVLLTKHLAVMLGAGLTINESLEIAKDQASGKLKYLLEDIYGQVLSGKTLADCLARHPKVFSQIFINVIKVGEESGTLEENLKHLSIQLIKDLEMRRKIKAAMIYPFIVLCATVILGGVISIFVLPKLISLFSAFEFTLPLSTKILLWLAKMIKEQGLYWACFLIILIFLARFFVKISPVRSIWHRIILKFPIAGRISRNVNLARFCRNLGSLLKSGVPVAEALKIVSDTFENVVYKRTSSFILDEIKKGKSISGILRKYEFLFPKITSRMIAVGEKSGSLEDVLLYLASYYEDEIDAETKNLAITLEPVLLVIIGLVVGFVAISIITPIYQMTASLGK